MSWDADEEREICDRCGEGAEDDLWPAPDGRLLCGDCYLEEYGTEP